MIVLVLYTEEISITLAGLVVVEMNAATVIL